MKSKLFFMATLCAIAFTANAQTKGTNALSFGMSTNVNTQSTNGGSENKSKNNSFTLGYGYFTKDNNKIGLELNYDLSRFSRQEYNNGSSAVTFQEFKTYGGNVNYQKYYPLLKTLFAFAGGRASYSFGEQKASDTNFSESKFNGYGIGAYGGITWFVSKRFAFETTLLAANANYSVQEQTDNSNGNASTSKSTSFNVASQGLINNLGFKIYLLF